MNKEQIFLLYLHIHNIEPYSHWIYSGYPQKIPDETFASEEWKKRANDN